MSDSNFPTPPYSPAPATAPFAAVAPMSFGQILDRIFQLLRAHWKPFVGIGLLPIGAVVVIDGLFFGSLFLAGVFKQPPAQPNVAAILWLTIPFFLIFVPTMFLMYGLYYGASNYAAVEADHGRAVTAGEALRHAWNRIGRYVWLMVLRSLIIAIPIFVLVFAVLVGWVAVIRDGNANPAALFFLIPLAFLFYLGAAVYAIIMSLRLSLAFPACVKEGLTAVQAIKRSGVLTQGAKGRIFLMLVVIYAIGYALVIVLYAIGLFVFAIAALAGAANFQHMTPLGYAGLGLLGVCGVVLVLLWSVLLMAAYSIAFAVFYRDQRLRRDGPPPAPVPASATA